MTHENQLWRQFTNGDAASFEQLYSLYFPKLTQYALRFGRDQNFVSEVIQDLFVKLWQNRSQLTEPDSVKFYLIRALRNTALNKLQSSSREVLVDSWEDLSKNEPYEGLEDRFAEEEVRFDLGVLTDRQREAIHLFYFQNLSYQEISDLLQMNIGGAYKLIYRALDALRSSEKKSRQIK